MSEVFGVLTEAQVLSLIQNNHAEYRLPQTLTDAPITLYAIPASKAPNAIWTLTANRTLAAITGALPGHAGRLWIIQDVTGGWSLTLDATQTDVLSNLSAIDAMIGGEVAVITWTTRDGVNFEFFIRDESIAGQTVVF